MLPLNIRLAIKEILPVLRGWGGKVERPYRMAELIVEQRPKVVVEIGVFGGQSLIPQALALKVLGCGKIYGIDPYNIDVIKQEMAELDDEAMWLKQDMNVVREDTLRWIRDLGLDDVVHMIRHESKDAAFIFDYMPIDILHIDGAHTEKGVMLDVDLFGLKVRIGGHIWLDDSHFPSLAPAIRKLETFCDLVEDWGGYRLYRRR